MHTALWGIGLSLLLAQSALAVEAGQTGYGVSVFQGETPERFEVEILGTLHGSGSAGDLILARLSGDPVDHTGVMQGMSGSPVWIEGELIGAVMSTWAFAKDPIAGIRPLDEMRRLSDYLESGDHPSWVPGQSHALAPASSAEIDLTDPETTWTPAALELPALNSDVPAGLLWVAAGFPPALTDQMETVLGASVSVAGSSRSAHRDESSLAPGDAMAAVLVRGDASLAAVGTVTAVDGDTVLGFGHPFLGLGPVSLPMARARVVALLPSQQLSFKMAEATDIVGSLLVDRRAGVCGKLGVSPDLLPITVSLRAPGEDAARTYSFEVARLPQLLPNLVAWTAQSVLVHHDEPRDDATLTADIRVQLENEAPLQTRAVLSGGSMGAALAAEVAFPVGLTAANAERAVRLKRIDIQLELANSRRVARLGQLRLSTRRPEPGETLRVDAELLPYRGEPQWTRFEIEIPDYLRPGPIRLHLVDGGTAFREEITRAIPRWSYPGFTQIRDALQLREPSNSLIAVLYSPSQSVVVRGVELERVPPSVRYIVGRDRADDTRVAATAVARAVVETPWVLNVGRHESLTLASPNSKGD